VRDISAQRHTQLFAVIGKELGIVGPMRDCDVGHTVVEQVFSFKLSVDVNQHRVGSLALAGMAGHCIAVIEMRMLTWIELHLAAAVHLE
jgi:hypothetical protein